MNPVIKVDDVAYCTLQVPDLDLQEKFLIDFGMTRVARTEDTLYMCGDGPQSYIHVSRLGEKKFLATAFKALSMDDLKKISSTVGFSDVEALDAPGGGYITRGHDPDSIGVDVVFGIESREADVSSEETNIGDFSQFRRINQIKRFQKGSTPRIKRYAHYGLNATDLKGSFDWYNANLGIIASDYLHPGGEQGPLFGIFCRCDRGDQPADHHSIFFLPAQSQSNGVPGLNHVSFEMIDLDDVFRGHELLEEKGYELEWGIGRHYQGSQIFDYWRSPFGQIHEHQTDGDVFDSSHPPQVIDILEDGDPAAPEPGPSQWGPSINMETFGDERGL
jgi:catechol 2,3-dioxygenase-like lactoylglutathione lyase family enzyme